MASALIPIKNIPLGSRIVYTLSALTYVSYSLGVADLRCSVNKVFYHYDFLALLLASVSFRSMFALVVAIIFSWKRFGFIEYQVGTIGFLLWFAWASVVFHCIYCCLMFALSFFDHSVIFEEIHGLWPLIIINVVTTVRDSGSQPVWLWPLPYHVPASYFPGILIVIAWVSREFFPFDALVAYLLACLCPVSVLEPSITLLDQVEQHNLAKVLLGYLQDNESYVCRPPGATFRVGGFGVMGGESCNSSRRQNDQVGDFIAL